MKQILLISTIIALMFSCKTKSNLEIEYNCQSTTSFSNTEEYIDFKEKFSLEIPKQWSTQYFYNSYESKIMTADTVKTLSNTFLLDVSYLSGNLVIDQPFYNKIMNDLLTERNLETAQLQKTTFKNMPAIWQIAKGKKGEFDINYFQLFAKKSKSHYYKLSAEVYGNEKVEQRLCEALALMSSFKVKKGDD